MTGKTTVANFNRADQKLLHQAREVLEIEARELIQVAQRLDERFIKMVEMIAGSKGRLIISGIGKSGIIGRKIVATLNSIGNHSLFLHPVEAMHGDLGVVRPEDIFMALSAGGETNELNSLLPSIRAQGCPIIAFCGNPDSHLVNHCDLVIDVGVAGEACPLGLVPTTSTTVMLAMGDALAVALAEKMKFKSEDFHRNHPGGLLGKRLAGQVTDLIVSGDKVPLVPSGTTVVDAVAAVDRGGIGAVMVVDEHRTLMGIITDGDIRRMVVAGRPMNQLSVEDIMTAQPKSVTAQAPSYDALNLMERCQITVLPVTEKSGRVSGVLHLHDILGKGAFSFSGSAG